MLDAAGCAGTRIVCSGDLDEYRIADLLAAGAPIDGFGVGTSLVTSTTRPRWAGCTSWSWRGRPVMKAAAASRTCPAATRCSAMISGDMIGLVGETLAGEPLLQPVMRNGQVVAASSLEEIRGRARAQVDNLPLATRALRDPVTIEPSLSPRLEALEEAIAEPA